MPADPVDETLDYDELHRYWEVGHQNVSPVFAFRGRLVRELMPPAGEGRLALDAGCGTGVHTRELLARGYRVDAFDGSRYAIDFLRERLRGADDRFEASVCDLFTFTPRRGPYDLIVFSEVLEHIPDDAAALARLAQMLAPGGALLLTVPLGPELYGAEDSKSGHQRRYRLRELHGRLRDANLLVVSERVYGFPLLYLYLWLKKLLVSESALARTSERVSASPLRSGVLRALSAVLLRVDRCFMWTRRGVGVVLLAHRP